ncbi:MAG: efflux RND transporter periplasmic adaptor subunit [Phycisphaerales bacterium]|nr:efflux RND transporter periplasmic adaptor subunit [Phycisphaerales bacterium]
MTAETPTTNSPALAHPSSPRRGRLPMVLALLAFTAGGIYVGMRWHSTFERWLVPSAGSAAPASQGNTAPGPAKKQLWTCGMHPQVIQDHPGECPICHMKLTPLVTGDAAGTPAASPDAPGRSLGNRERRVKYWHDPMMNPPYISDRPGKSPMGMDLVPVYEDEAQSSGAEVVIDPAVVQNMGVRTAAVARGVLAQRVRATAIIAEQEPARTDINLRVSGWIQKLYADTEGMTVHKGDPLFDLYSPDLRLAVEELIAARRAAREPAGDSLVSAAELRLQTLGLSDEQIARLGSQEHAPGAIAFESPVDGILVEKANAYNGSSVMAGQVVMRIADRSTMWVDARVPEGSLSRVRVGQHAAVTVDALGGREFKCEVIFIHPDIDEATRTALVRMSVPNPDGLLRLGMYAIARIDTSSAQEVIVVPREAVIESGESSLVFLSTGRGHFVPRRVTVGASGADGTVEITSGLALGETVVTSGQFLLDSESRLREAIAKFLGQSTAAPAPGPTAANAGAHPASDAKAPAELVDKVTAEYLAIAEPFGEEKPDTPPANIDALLAAIDALAAKAGGADAGRLAGEAREATLAMRGRATDDQRTLFKRVSASIIAIADAMPPSDAVAAPLYVANCPMAKADWLQRSEELANPYYAEDMKECGSIVRRIGDKPAGGKRGAP